MSVVSSGVGKSAISNVAVVKAREKKTTKKGPKVVNEIFHQIIPHTEDHYWKGVFSSAARGKFPPGFKFYNSKLFFKLKKSDEVSMVVPNDPLSAVKPITNFMKIYGVNTSDNQESKNVEKIRAEKLYNNFVERMKRTNSWSDIKSKNAKMELVDRFVYKTSLKYNFDDITRKRFSSIIKLNINAKYLSNEHIIVRCGDIREIVGISYDPETKEIIQNVSKPKPQKKTQQPEKKKEKQDYFLSMWVKFLRDISGKSKKEFSAEDFSDIISKVEENSVPPTPVSNSKKTKAKTPVEDEEYEEDDDEFYEDNEEAGFEENDHSNNEADE
jgi:hypothetical protein